MASLLPPLARALSTALSNPDMSVVCNVGYAQVVDHVHWHVVPAPTPGSSSGRKQQSGWGGLSLLGEAMGRTELDEADGKQLAEAIRGALEHESLPGPGPVR